MKVGHLFNSFVHHVSNDGYFSSLTHSHSSCNRLFFNRWVPLRFNNVHAIGNSEIKSVSILVRSNRKIT